MDSIAIRDWSCPRVASLKTNSNSTASSNNYEHMYRKILFLLSSLLFTVVEVTSSCHGCKIIYLHACISDIVYNIDLDEYPQSTTIGLGGQGSLYCSGNGSYLYWYIDGVNTKNMSSEALQGRGIEQYGDHGSPYDGSCDYLCSIMTITGNCLNNNTEVYCVILGSYPPPYGGNTTSPIAIIIVSSTYIDC